MIDEEYQALVDRLPRPTVEEYIQAELFRRALIEGSGSGRPRGIVNEVSAKEHLND
jgi:hypothetical protein